MVDKINGNSSYDYPNQKDGRKGSAIQAYERTPGKKETAKNKSAGTRNAGSRIQEKTPEQRGVILDLSSGQRKGPAAKPKTSLLDAVRKIVTPVITWIKNIWASDAQAKEDGVQLTDAGASVKTTVEIPVMEDMPDHMLEAAGSLPPLDEVNEIPDYESLLDDALKSRDLEKMEQLLTQNGSRRLAHHSDLLTYYDRRGKLVELDDTAKHRVLYGDKNIMKL